MTAQKRAFFVLLLCCILLVGAVCFVTYFGKQSLMNASDELRKKKATQIALDDRLTRLASAKQYVTKYAALAQTAEAIVPQSKDQAQAVLALASIAEESGVEIASINFPQSALGEAKKSKGSSSKTTYVDPNTTQLTAVTGTDNLYAMEISLSSNADKPVPYERLITFLEKLEANRRTAHVTALTINPDNANRNLLSFDIIMQVYIKL